MWFGDAVTGVTRRLSSQPEGVSDQTITGDGSAVIAATRTGRLLSIDTATGAVTQLLGSPGPAALFFPTTIPGFYNEVVGSFPDGAPEILIGSVPAPQGSWGCINWISAFLRTGRHHVLCRVQRFSGVTAPIAVQP